MSTTIPVLIVGAGPAGLVAALTLLKNGISVRIIDKAAEFHVGRRGRGLQPRTLELFHILGVLPDIMTASAEIVSTRVYKMPGGTEVISGFTMSPPVEPTPSTPFPRARSLGQDCSEGILREHLAKLGCHVELSTELLSFEQHPDHVTARIAKHQDGKDSEEIVNCHYLVGTDGGKGVVRKQLGLSFLGETRGSEQHIVVADFQLSGLDPQFAHQWGEPSTKFASLRPPEHDGYWTLLGGGKIDHAKIVADKDELVAFLHAATDRDDITVGHVKWTSEYRPNIRMVDKFGEGRVFLAGDAAHVHPPTGGQGLNSSVQDAFNLGWKLALVEKGLATPALLASYDEERLPVIAAMLQKSGELLTKTFNAKAGDTTPWQRGGALMQLGVNYRWSSIVVDEWAGAKDAPEKPVDAYGGAGAEGIVRGGDRAPDAPGLQKIKGPDALGDVTSLFSIFSAAYHTVLVLTSSAEEASTVLAGLKQYPADIIRSVVIAPAGSPAPAVDADIVLEDRDGHAYAGYGIEQGQLAVVIVRPDDYVGGLVRGVQGVESYFARVFGGAVTA